MKKSVKKVVTTKYNPKLKMNQLVDKPNWFAMRIFSAEPNGVKVEARLILIVTPKRNGVGLTCILLQVLMIMGMKITATERSSIIEAQSIAMRQIDQKNFWVLV